MWAWARPAPRPMPTWARESEGDVGRHVGSDVVSMRSGFYRHVVSMWAACGQVKFSRFWMWSACGQHVVSPRKGQLEIIFNNLCAKSFLPVGRRAVLLVPYLLSF